ncbi:putative Solute carrier family 5 (Sodium/myo-inositol cotransporter), member 3 [Verrucomicrobia bacterium]|nr:putative Solute carrier family 5 (Sodium/myo-inositol cotransporter), member 3 [Verrucomicrobiota bacterium]
MQLHLTSIDWTICLAALAFNVALGLYLGLLARKKADSSSFFLAGRTLTWSVVGASLFSTNIGSEHMVGLSGDSYRYGICAGTVELITVVALGITAAVLLPYYIRNKVFTIPEFLELRYRSEARMCFSGLMVFICIVTKMAFTMYAGALVMQAVTGWGIMPSVLIMGVITALITIIGGFGVVAYTDAIHSPIMIVGSGIILFTGLHKVGGWRALCAAVQSSPVPDAMHIHKAWTDPVYPFWGVVLTVLYAGLFYWGMDQVNVQRLLGARDLKQARWGAMFAALLKLTPIFIFALPGVIALALNPHISVRDSRGTFIWILDNLLPSGLRGYVLAALLGAVVCSTIAVMNSVSTIAVRDFILRFRPKIAEADQVRLGRLAIIVAMALGVGAAGIIAWQPEGIYKYLQTISIYLSMPLAPAIIFGVLSKRVTFAGAAASFLSGIALSALFVVDALLPNKGAAAQIFPLLHYPITENYTYRGLWGSLVITFILFSVSAFTKKTDAAKLQQTTINWGGSLEPFQGLSDWRLHLSGVAILTVLAYWWLW